MHYKIAQLILTSGRKTNTASEIFIAQPDAAKEALAGKLFVVAEIESKRSEGLKIINFLINDLNYNYYQNEKIILREKISTLKVEHIFESALAKTNKNLARFLQTEKIKINPSLINVTAGIIYKNSLHFVSVGKNKALLIYNNKQSENEAKYKVIDVAQQAKTDNHKKQLSLAKLFTNVISGTIPCNSYFIFANETLPEYLSNEQLINIITTLPPAGAIEQIKNMLSKINAYVSFLGIIIKNTTGLESVELNEKIQESSTQTSLNNLNITEETTEKLLTLSGITSPRKLSTAFSKSLSKINSKFIKPAKSNNKLLLKRKNSLLLFEKINLMARSIVSYFINFISSRLPRKASGFQPNLPRKDDIDTERRQNALDELNKPHGGDKSKLNKIINGLKYSFLDIFKRPVEWFKNLNKKNKILIILAVICLLFFVQNLFILNLNNKKTEKGQDYTNLINLIEQKQNQTEASLLYNNEENAKKLLDEIKPLLAQLPQETEKQTEQFNQFTEKYNQQLEKIRHVIRINSPSELADFANLNSNAQPINLILVNSIIYAGDSQQESIYSLNLTGNLITAITDLKLPINELKYPTVDKNNNVYYFNLDSIIKLNTETEEITNLTIKFADSQQDIAGIDSHNNRLYLLDRQNNQIYRYNIGQNSLTNSQPWLNEKTDLADSVDISIDGHIYALTDNGQLLKYLKGQEQKFNLEKIDPELERPDKLIVSPELKFIYILELTNKRLVIFDKTGKFLLQYKCSQFTDLKDFTVDEATGKIYFLDGTSVYEVEGTHFEE